MSTYIPTKVWTLYKNIINEFMASDVAKHPITWAKANIPYIYGEDSGITYKKVDLYGLINYNAYRTWPINIGTSSGELDGENMAILITSKVLSEAGYLDSNGYWDLDSANDRFVINGKIYKSSGDTQVAQADSEALIFMLILKREEEKKLKYET
jgi:hypothetical protein